MADPVSWALIAVQMASSAVEGIQGYQQGQQEAAVAGQNAQIARDNAARARMDAGLAEEAQRRESRKTLGRAAAAGAQSGTAGAGPGQGSLGALNAQSANEAELDALNIRYGGETEAHADLTQAAQFDFDRKAAKQRARGAVISGLLGTAAAGLSGYSDYRRSTGGGARTTIARPTPPRTSRTHYTQLPRTYGGRY